MIGTRESPAASSALRIPATRPSIMSLGATMSMPARACVTATLPSRYTDASLSTSPSCTTPQCPWSVYSHRQTSPTTTTSGPPPSPARPPSSPTPSPSYASPAHPRRGGVAHVALRGCADLHRAILRRDAPVEPFPPASRIPFPAVRSHRRLTSAFERGKKASLGCDLTGARRVLERHQRIAGF